MSHDSTLQFHINVQKLNARQINHRSELKKQLGVCLK